MRNNKPQTTQKFFIIWVGAIFLLLACNLGTAATETPATLMPRLTATPQPTLGFSGNTGAPSVTIVPANINTPIVDSQVEVQNLVNAVETDRLMVHVESLQNFYTRHVNSTTTSDTQGIGAARRYIENYFKNLQQTSNGRVYTFSQEFPLTYGGITTTQYNVVAVIQGTENGAGTLIVGAHYDSVGQPFESATAYAPGAADNGTGIAAIMEMARILAERPMRSSIMLVAFSAEEVGRVGSKAFARYVVEQGIDCIGMINIDTIGNQENNRGQINDTELRVFSDGNQANGIDTISRQMARTAEFISFTEGLSMKLIVEDKIDREGRYGDHFSFSEVGIPAIRFIQAFEEKTNADPTDTIEYVEPGYLTRATQSILMVINSMAQGPRPPRNITLRDAGDGKQTLVWEGVPDATGYIVALRVNGSLRYDQQIEWEGTSLEWDGFRLYGSIAIAARGPNGIVGPLSVEYPVSR
jgi:bacterial leucyl aminopeptidase